MVAFVTALGVSADICSEKHEGKFIRNRDDCSRYYECDGDVIKMSHACFDNTLFDTKTESCQPPDTVDCENVNETMSAIC